MQRFELSEREPRPNCKVVAVSGELDLAVAGQLDELLTQSAEETAEVLVDLGPCQFIDSSGIAVIIRAHNRMSEEGKRLAVYGPSAQVQRILEMTGLTGNSLVYETEAEALAASGD